MTKLVKVTIDAQTVSVPEGTLIVDAAKKAGIDIPVFCYHPKMQPVGMCRMCLVEVGRPVMDRATGQPVIEADTGDGIPQPKIQFGPKLETACTVPVSDGMVVITQSDKVKAARKDVLEFLLTSHPLDCPICDKGGECPLQNLTLLHGPGESRFLYDEKMHLAKQVPLGELIVLDRERCIQCGRCVRFQDEIVDDPVIGFYQRGRRIEIMTNSEPGFDSVFSGNTTDICPVGALTTADFRFGARPWELTATASICPHCPVGCNLTFNVRREVKAGGGIVIKRALPRQNEAVNEIWMCDKGRFAYHYAESKERLATPLVRRRGELTPASWEEALGWVADNFRDAGRELLTLASGRLSNEDLFNLRQLTDGLKGQAALYTHMAGGDLTDQAGVAPGTNFSDMGKGAAIVVIASDLHEEAPIWWLRVRQAAGRGATLIVANARPTKLERYATQIIRYAYGDEVAAVGQVANLPYLREAENAVILFGSDGLGLEGSQALAQACAELLIATNHPSTSPSTSSGFQLRAGVGRPNNGLIGVWPRANDQGAWDMGFRPLTDDRRPATDDERITDALANAIRAAKAVYIVAADPVGDGTVSGHPSSVGGFLVVQDLFLTEAAKLADVVLPAQAFTEREGTFTSGERRVQRYYPAVLARPGPQPDFAITAQIAKRLNIELEGRLPAAVFARIAAAIPAYAGLSYRKLAETTEQWPVVGRGDLYYGGTAYENKQGLGMQLPLTPLSSPHSRPISRQDFGQVGRGENVGTEGGLLAVPITRLYDLGQTVTPSALLRQRIGEPDVALHPADAVRLGVADGSPVALTLNGQDTAATARLDENVPVGIVLIPRSMGIPISGPATVEIRAAERIEA